MKNKTRFYLFLSFPALVICLVSIYLNRTGGILPGQFTFLTDNIKTIQNPDGSREGVDYIFTGNYANQVLYYYYFIPPGVAAGETVSPRYLILVPGLSGSGERFAAKKKVKEFAAARGFAVLSPSFTWDRRYWEAGRSYQYPWVWSGRALIDIVHGFEKKQGVSGSGFFMAGFSAGAQFVMRFALWKPALCVACVGHAGGGWLNIKEAVPVKFLVTVGKKDRKRMEIARRFHDRAQQLGMDTTLKVYDHGHGFSPQQLSDTLDFFSNVPETHAPHDSRPR